MRPGGQEPLLSGTAYMFKVELYFFSLAFIFNRCSSSAITIHAIDIRFACTFISAENGCSAKYYMYKVTAVH